MVYLVGRVKITFWPAKVNPGLKVLKPGLTLNNFFEHVLKSSVSTSSKFENGISGMKKWIPRGKWVGLGLGF